MTNPRDERGRYKPGVAYAGPVVYQLMGEQIARRRVLDQAVRNTVRARARRSGVPYSVMLRWLMPTHIGNAGTDPRRVRPPVG